MEIPIIARQEETRVALNTQHLNLFFPKNRERIYQNNTNEKQQSFSNIWMTNEMNKKSEWTVVQEKKNDRKDENKKQNRKPNIWTV